MLVILPLIVILFSLGYYYSLGKYVKTENAYIKAPIISIQAEVSGKIKNVFVVSRMHSYSISCRERRKSSRLSAGRC